jgi:hypothetical protein
MLAGQMTLMTRMYASPKKVGGTQDSIAAQSTMASGLNLSQTQELTSRNFSLTHTFKDQTQRGIVSGIGLLASL